MFRIKPAAETDSDGDDDALPGERLRYEPVNTREVAQVAFAPDPRSGAVLMNFCLLGYRHGARHGHARQHGIPFRCRFIGCSLVNLTVGV